MKFKTAEELKEIDRRCVWDYRIPALLLMENAGRGASEMAKEINPSRRQTVILVGKGNNGGDGLVVARFLRFWKVPVKVWMIGASKGYRKNSAPWYNHQIVKRLGIPIEHYMGEAQSAAIRKDVSNAGLIVDAMFGVGLSGDVREPYAGIIGMVNDSGSKVLAIDVPSGLDSDTGEPLGIAVKALKTATFAAMKKGFENEASRKYTGEVVLIDIGVPPELL